MNMLEILEETVAYYSEDTSRRAITTNGACKYIMFLANTVKMCAVGRCLADPNSLNNEDAFTDQWGHAIFRPEYSEAPMFFWVDLQSLHDDSDCWNFNGLTKLGHNTVEAIKNKIAAGLYENTSYE